MPPKHKGKSSTRRGASRASMTVAERLAAGGNLSIDEFAAWANIGKVTVYAEAKRGRVKISKAGRRSMITGPNALAWRALLEQQSA